jgi:hypothetical protein
MTTAFLVTAFIVVPRATPQTLQTNSALPERLTDGQKDSRVPITYGRGSHAGAAVTAPNIGGLGTLDVLEGGGSSRVWSFDRKATSGQERGGRLSPYGSCLTEMPLHPTR